MAVVRRNIVTNAAARDKYIQGVKLLKKEASGRTTAEFGIPGAARSVSTYDLFVIWHVNAMMQETPAGNPAGRNAAHRGPVFTPWHRVMLMILEQNLQRALNDADFGLPYWDWARDGDLPAGQQGGAAIWRANCMGGQGNPITTGPFAFRADDSASFRVRVATNSAGELEVGELRPAARFRRQRRRAAEDDACQERDRAHALRLARLGCRLQRFSQPSRRLVERSRRLAAMAAQSCPCLGRRRHAAGLLAQ